MKRDVHTEFPVHLENDGPHRFWLEPEKLDLKAVSPAIERSESVGAFFVGDRSGGDARITVGQRHLRARDHSARGIRHDSSDGGRPALSEHGNLTHDYCGQQRGHPSDRVTCHDRTFFVGLHLPQQLSCIESSGPSRGKIAGGQGRRENNSHGGADDHAVNAAEAEQHALDHPQRGDGAE